MNGRPADLAAVKALLRKEIRARLTSLSVEERSAGSRLLVERALSLEVWRQAAVVALFVPMADEPAIWPVAGASLAAGKIVAIPGYDSATGIYSFRRITGEDDLVSGRYGIAEPASGCEVLPIRRLDLAFVPGICFSSDGGRVGRGKGFYDRLLQPFRGVSCGVGFDLQIVSSIPDEPHDVKLNLLLTPTRLLVAAAAGSTNAS
jgi:5-formyltetrahydrofolate cyclo-ligase